MTRQKYNGGIMSEILDYSNKKLLRQNKHLDNQKNNITTAKLIKLTSEQKVKFIFLLLLSFDLN